MSTSLSKSISLGRADTLQPYLDVRLWRAENDSSPSLFRFGILNVKQKPLRILDLNASLAMLSCADTSHIQHHTRTRSRATDGHQTIHYIFKSPKAILHPKHSRFLVREPDLVIVWLQAPSAPCMFIPPLNLSVHGLFHSRWRPITDPKSQVW